MAQFIDNTTDEHFNSMIYGEQHPANVAYIANQFANQSNEFVSEIGRQMYEKTYALYNAINDNPYIQKAQAALRVAVNVMQPDNIYEIHTIDQARLVRPVMQRYIMTEPTIRELYHAQGCDGYSNTYIDRQPGVVGHNHYEYKQVMNGMVVFNDSEQVINYNDEAFYNSEGYVGDEQALEIMADRGDGVIDTDDIGSWSVHTYAYDLEYGDVELRFREKVNILTTWELIRRCVDARNDPTDIMSSKLT
jgi:phage tail protein X